MKNIKKSHIKFLEEIKENNNREWFAENKQRYLWIKKEIEIFSAHWFWSLNQFDESLQNPWEKPYMFRIYRDARFAKGKFYKTNYWLLIWPGWKPAMHEKATYFLNIEPGNNFLIGWVWRPEPFLLKQIRENIDDNSKDLRKILNKKTFKENFTFTWSQLKTSPKGYKTDNPNIDLLKYKDFYAIHRFTDEEILSENFFEELVKLSKNVYPLLEYINNLK